MSVNQRKENFWQPVDYVLKKIKSNQKIPVLILFDIDGTLVIAPKVHNQAFVEAFKEIFGLNINVDWFAYSGRTDSWIISDIAIKNGISIEEINRKLENIMESMGRWYSNNVQLESGQVLPGVVEFLRECDQKGYLRGLVTGNVERIAFEKLKFYGLNHGFAVGGFGNEHMIRDELIKLAIKRAIQNYNFEEKVDLSNVFYIADTPLDVQAAKRAGVKSIVPYNGRNNKADWKHSEPDLFVKDLGQLSEIFGFINSNMK
jgi:phosphoglycolate phosphatase